MVVTLSCLLMSDVWAEVDADSYVDQIHEADGTREGYEKAVVSLRERISNLTAEQQWTLYVDVASKLGGFDLPERPDPLDYARWSVIGVLLEKAKDRRLAVRILANTPPGSVGFLSLEQYVKEAEPALIVDALRLSASEMAQMKRRVGSQISPRGDARDPVGQKKSSAAAGARKSP